MTSKELTGVIIKRLNRVKLIIFIGGVSVAILMFMIAKYTPPIYSVKSTLYPLTSVSEGSSASSKLTELIGEGGRNSKTLSDEANVNIEEVAKSRRTREAVVAARLPEFGNKPIAVILIEEYNKNKSRFSPIIKVPSVETELYSTGANLFVENYTVKFNKNSLLEIVFTSTNQKLIKPGSLVLIDKISQFYKELKIKKAQFDFDFTQKKVDSFQRVLNQVDNKRIHLNNTTLFVVPGKVQYTIPKENLENNKQMILAQRNGAASNREEALWRKQRVTPIIEILDAPEPPYNESKPSMILYGVIGFLVGCLIFTLFSISGIVYRYFTFELKKKLNDTSVEISPVSTTA